MAQVRAPWTPEQVSALNAWQANTAVHPFTCPADGTLGSEKHSDRRILVATTERWECERCAYVQHWAHDFMVVAPSALIDPAQPSMGGHIWPDSDT